MQILLLFNFSNEIEFLKMKNARLSPEEELAKLKAEIEQLEAEIKESASDFPSIPYDKTDEEKGELLLQAFLNDEPFDRFIFGYFPIKISLINAALKTKDPEIIVAILYFVMKSLDKKSFNELLDQCPEARAQYDHFSGKTSKIVKVDRNATHHERVEDIERRYNESSGLLNLVLKDELQRVRTGDSFIGMEQSDIQWEFFGSAMNTHNFSIINPKEMSSKKKIGKKWKRNVNPTQAAILARAWGYPDEIIQGFAILEKNSNDKMKLSQLGII